VVSIFSKLLKIKHNGKTICTNSILHDTNNHTQKKGTLIIYYVEKKRTPGYRFCYLYIYIKVEVIMYKSYFLFFCWKLLFIWLWENYLLKPSA